MKIGRMSFVAALSFFSVAAATGQTKDAAKAAAPTKKARVLVLGVFHMANPGRDMFNLQVDDVLAPKRQKELSELAETLKKFQPTKIALESPVGGEKIRKQYNDYLAGNYSLTRSEGPCGQGIRAQTDLWHRYSRRLSV